MLSDLTTLVHQNVTKLLLSSVSIAALLFSAGEPGQLMPVDPAYLYQDTAGTTPVTAAGQSVALQLDQSKGLVLGPELVTNANLAPSWTVGGSNTVSQDGDAVKITYVDSNAGALVFLASGALSQNFVVGRRYKVTFEARAEVGSSVTLGGSDGNLSFSSFALSSTYQTFTAYLGFSSGTPYIGRVNDASFGPGEAYWVRNISVKELPGNHDTQPTVGSRPIYGKHPYNGYRNMLASSEDFSAAVWGKANATVTANAAVAPDGTTTAGKLDETATTASHYAYQVYTSTGVSIVSSIYAKASERRRIAIWEGTTSANGAVFDLVSGTVVNNLASGVGSIQSVGNGWYRCSVVSTETAGTRWFVCSVLLDNATGVGGTVGVAGNGIYIWGAQLETGSTATTYQRTGATSGVAWPAPPSYDITEAGQPDLHYLHYNGVSSFMVSPTITPGIDKAQVFVGVRKLANSPNMIVELSANGTSNAGTFYFLSGDPGGTDWASFSRGSAAAASNQTATIAQIAPDTAVITATHDIVGDLSVIRRNAVNGTNGTGDKGAGNFLAYPIYTGRRGGVSFPFSGLVYSKIIRFGANLTADQIASTERWTAQRTGVSL